MKQKEYSIEIGGKKITAIFSDLVDQANSVIMACGGTRVLVTAVMSKEKSQTDWFNLTVDYIEKFYASGKIGGGRFMKREGKPTDEAILAGRVIDRTLRPLFNQQMEYGVQIIATVLAMDESVDPGILAVNGASLALDISEIPWAGPVGAVRLISKDGENLWNPSQKKRVEGFDYDLIVCGKEGKINMIEAVAYQTPEDKIAAALGEAEVEISKLENWQKEIRAEIGKEKKVLEIGSVSKEALDIFEEKIRPNFMSHAMTKTPGKEKMEELKKVWKDLLKENFREQESFKKEVDYFESELDLFIHNQAIDANMRADGRAMDELREIYSKAGGFSEVLHGSGIFYRGQTHIFTALTLGGPEDMQIIDGMEVEENKHFMHHYNFPPFSVGEMGRAGFVNRREVGHGALAEKALEVVLPSKLEFPYTIRLVSEAMASNGSTSQASICASTLALMDGGVPIKAPVAGIAMGLMYRDENKYKVLTDIQGPEDHYGDMDFKVAGTKNGLTAIQLDVKVEGVSLKILTEAMMQSLSARSKILESITKEIAEPRKDISPFAPKIVVTKINPDSIGKVIGSGGKTINEIREKTKTEITIEDDGTVFITGKDKGPEEAKLIIENMTHEWKIGDVTSGEVTGMKEFGAFVKLTNGQEGMVHISEIAPFRVEKVEEVLKIGQIVPVKVIKNEMGKLGLSIKEADKDFVKNPKG
ncbi:MAG: polyribonucleotide nucleotidyltransferase [Patescibacteria group bacterium]|jgi:polyribonucleotide nucleotidyltransferase|nr:polyribonucleotide nucleotidyltransferase [Patescibacteria group bacterium]